MADIIPWIATAATIVAAFMTAANLGSRITGFGFAVFLIGSVAWLANGLLTGQPALAWTNAVLTLLNIFGVWRWLGRQARVEEGAHTAVEASKGAPEETLFPASLLTSARVLAADGRELGHCVDAMAGCQSGRLKYVVVSTGGVAGLGERLRRVEWSGASIEEDALCTTLSRQAIEGLHELPRAQSPAR